MSSTSARMATTPSPSSWPRGNADLPWLMTDYHLTICPANDDGTLDWQSGDGSGPYKIDAASSA
jgi:hypothetical protein